MPETDRFLSVAGAARYCGCSVILIRRLIATGQLPAPRPIHKTLSVWPVDEIRPHLDALKSRHVSRRRLVQNLE